MLIQNASNITSAPQPARPPSDGGSVAASGTQSNVAAPAEIALELPQPAVKPAAEQKADAAQLKNAVENINRALKASNKNLEFSIDNSTEKPVFRLKDSETGEVIRQYPTEDMLAITRAIDQIQQGILLKQEA